MGRRQNLASSGQISCASSEFGVEKEKNILKLASGGKLSGASV